MSTQLAYRAAWALWILAGVGLEIAALLNAAEGDTLSANVWWLLDKAEAHPWGVALVGLGNAVIIGLGGWLVIHFVVGRFFRGRI